MKLAFLNADETGPVPRFREPVYEIEIHHVQAI
jgi:hypothetical protein